MRSSPTTLTPQELAIMKLVWSRDRATVREVYEAMRHTRPVAYTTVIRRPSTLFGSGVMCLHASMERLSQPP